MKAGTFLVVGLVAISAYWLGKNGNIDLRETLHTIAHLGRGSAPRSDACDRKPTPLCEAPQSVSLFCPAGEDVLCAAFVTAISADRRFVLGEERRSDRRPRPLLVGFLEPSYSPGVSIVLRWEGHEMMSIHPGQTDLVTSAHVLLHRLAAHIEQDREGPDGGR